MAMPSSGSIGLKYCVGTTACSSVAQAVDGNQTGDKSLSTLSTTAGKGAPHCMREFYEYSAANISVSNPSTLNTSGQVTFNTLTASGAWTATKLDVNNVINSFSSSGAGSGKITASLASGTCFFDREATITYCITASPTTTATWTINILANT